MFKYFLGFGILLLCLIIFTIWFRQSRVSAVPVVPESYFTLPDTPSTPLAVPKKINEFIVTQPTILFKEVMDKVYEDDYIVISCSASGGKEKAVLLTAKLSEDNTTNNFIEARNAVRAWEPSILKDMGVIIFPNSTETDRDQDLAFTDVPDTEYRISPITISGQKTSLHYGWQDNYLFLASSKECLAEIVRSVQDGA